MPSLVDLLQVEFTRENGYRPDPKLFPNAIDLTPAGVLAINPNVSTHATQVAQLLTSGPAAGLIGKHQFIEAVTWMLGHSGPAVLCAGRTFAPMPLGADIVNCSFGASVLTADLFVKAKLQIERDNGVLIVAPPDAGDTSGYTFPGAVVSPNCLRVVSSTTGSVIVSSDIPMVSEPVSWNSFAEPVSAQVVAAMISWCKDQFNGTFKAADIVATILATAVKIPGFSYPQVNYNAAMTGLHSFYSIPVAVVVTPTPSPVANSPVVPTPPVPIATPPVVVVPVPVPIIPVGNLAITSFGHWNSSWSSVANPTTFYFTSTGATSAILIDPNGKTIEVTGKTQYGPVNKSANGSQWGYQITGPQGSVIKYDQVHGAL